MSVSNALIQYEKLRAQSIDHLNLGHAHRSQLGMAKPPQSIYEEYGEEVVDQIVGLVRSYNNGLLELIASTDMPIYSIDPGPANAAIDAIDTLPGDYVLRHDAPPSSTGMLYFQKAILLPTGESVPLMFWAPAYSLPDEAISQRESGGRYTLSVQDARSYGDADSLIITFVMSQDKGLYNTHVRWVYNESLDSGAYYLPPNDDALGLLKTFVSLWEFMRQKIAPPVSARASRPVVKSYRRLNGKEPPPLRIVKLRAYEQRISDRAESEGREWSHSWVVRGHWRNQWYPSRELHAPVWIAPYVKGDGPLLGGRKVFEVSR